MLLSDSDKNRIIEFIKENELDYRISNGPIFRFHILADDDSVFYINKYNEQYLIIKSDKEKTFFKYYGFQTLSQVMEQLSFYDNSLPKVWWYPIKSTVDIGFEKEGYTEEWLNDFCINENWSNKDWNEQYKYAVFLKKENIKVISPYNTLHEVSLFNTYSPADMDKLYFEIHPICVMEGTESYLVKILINNEEIMKEYINYVVRRKKGLRLFLENLFTNKNQYVMFEDSTDPLL